MALDERLVNASRPGAFGLMFDVPEPLTFDPSRVGDDGIAVLRVSGPLEHHDSWIWSSYDCITACVEAALRCEAVRAVVLRFDSPGGVVAGVREAARAMRRMRREHEKPLVAYVDEVCCSAAYWLASACDEIWSPETGQSGSIGVVLGVVDTSEHMKKEGVAIRYLTSGARKADLAPGASITEAALAEAQRKIDYLAGLFFSDVAKARGKKPAEIQALQAGVFHGLQAAELGLVDAVASWPKFLDTLRQSIGAIVAPSGTPSAAANQEAQMTKIQLRAAAAAAAKVLEGARAKYEASASDADLKAYAKAANAKIAADAALAAIEGKSTTTRHVKHEERVVEREEDDEEEEAEEDPPEKMKGEDEEPEEEEDEKSVSDMGKASAADDPVLATAYRTAGAAIRSKAPAASSSLALYAPERLVRHIATTFGGDGTIKGAFAAVTAAAETLKTARGLAARVEKLEADKAAGEISAIVTKAKDEGRTSGPDHRKQLRAFGQKFGVAALKEHVAMLPRRVRTEGEGALSPDADGDGAPTGLPSREDQAEAKLMDQLFGDLGPEGKTAAIATYKTELAKSKNGALPRS